MGHDVTVLTTSKKQYQNDLKLNFSDFKMINITNNTINRFMKSSAVSELKVSQSSSNKISLKLKLLTKLKDFIQTRGLLGAARMPDFTDFIIDDSYKAIKDESYDFIISTSGPYSEHLIALKYKKRYPKTFWIADYRDLWTQNHIYKGLFPFTLVENYLENRVNNTADYITSVSDPLVNQIKEKYKLTNVVTVENGFDIEDLDTISKDKYWEDDKIRLVYTGSIYKDKQDPSPLLQAIETLSKSKNQKLLERLELIFVGGNKADLDDLIEKYNVKKWVSYGGFLPREDSLRMQRDAHALIFLEFKAPGVDGILTGKLFEYLCSGTQILGIGVTDDSSAGKLIKQSGQGINFGKDSEKIINYLLELLKTNEKVKIDKNNEIIQRYSRESQAKRVLELLNKGNLK